MRGYKEYVPFLRTRCSALGVIFQRLSIRLRFFTRSRLVVDPPVHCLSPLLRLFLNRGDERLAFFDIVSGPLFS